MLNDMRSKKVKDFRFKENSFKIFWFKIQYMVVLTDLIFYFSEIAPYFC